MLDLGLMRIPRADSAQVVLDFDGTITCRDVLDDLIQRYAANDSWKQIELQWQGGQIGSRECLSREFALLRISRADLERFLDTVDIDPGMATLLGVLRAHHVPVAILSDGIDFFINRILKQHGICGIPVRANTLRLENGQWTLACPWANQACTSGAAHCKCASLEEISEPGRQIIYVGDGRSDLCPARTADVVFAKHVLARSLQSEGVPFLPYAGLDEIAAVLAGAWRASGGITPARRVATARAV